MFDLRAARVDLSGGVDPGRVDLHLAKAQSRSGVVRVEQDDRLESSARLVLAGIGTLPGCLAASGVLYYDGAGRVNVLAAVALLVGLQGVTIAPPVILMPPPAVRPAPPRPGAVQAPLGSLSPRQAW